MLRSEIFWRFRGDREANLFHRFAPGHHSTGERSRLSDLTIKEVASLKSLSVAPDQYPVVQVAVSQLPPSVIHSPVRNTSQTQIAFLESDGSTVQRLLRHHVQGVPLAHVRTFLTCLNCLSENAEYTRADAIGISARLDRVTRHRGHARALFHSAKANCFSRVTRLRYAQSRCAKRVLMFA